ncbi:MAG: SDR family oxidoreductase [Planctomycetaceae bacterium]|nr:SDR family oxidoreductase [Planctomycetaceae bacterium]
MSDEQQQAAAAAIPAGNPLTGHVAVVTGGAVRIGRAIALGLASAGADVCIHCGNSVAEAEAVCRLIQGMGRNCAVVRGDLSRPTETAREILSAAASQLGPVTILVNNAAVFEPDELATLTDEVWQRQLAINLQSPVWLSREFAAQLPEGRMGGIVNLADWRALRPVPGHLSYTIAKAGLVAATKLLAQELAPRVRVNAIAPGAILPPPESSDEQFQRLARKIPLRQTGGPEHIVQAVLFFLQNEFVTGEVLHVTGGQQLQSS